MPALLFFFAVGLTLSAIAWGAVMLLEPRESALEDRLADLQANASATAVRSGRRRAGGGFLNSFLYIVSRLGMDEYLRDTEKELAQAGIRRKEALAWYVLFHFGFLLTLLTTMLYL